MYSQTSAFREEYIDRRVILHLLFENRCVLKVLNGPRVSSSHGFGVAVSLVGAFFVRQKDCCASLCRRIPCSPQCGTFARHNVGERVANRVDRRRPRTLLARPVLVKRSFDNGWDGHNICAIACETFDQVCKKGIGRMWVLFKCELVSLR